jgi:hypothetical protein
MPTTTTSAAPVVEQRLFVVRPGPRCDPFAQLVRQVHDDPANPHNIERYLWVLEESPPEPCGECGQLFLPSFDYAGDAAGGHPRRYCSRRCAWRAAERRRPTTPRRRPAA